MDQPSNFEVKDFRAGFVCVSGLPSSGKSTFVNAMLGFKLSIVSPKPQTTREHIKAIINGKNYQAIFIDTPGLLDARNLLEKKMAFEIRRAASQDADVFCLLAEPSLERLQAKKAFFENLRISGRSLLLITKSDLYPQESCRKSAEFINSMLKFEKTIFISAKTGENLSLARKEIISLLPFSAPYYPAGETTDRWERFFAAELIRETIFENYKDEVPYSCAVEIEHFNETSSPTEIFANIHVSRETHKPIIIGEKGKAIKRLREISSKKISRLLGRQTNLFLTVKVTRDWQNNPDFLKKFYEH